VSPTITNAPGKTFRCSGDRPSFFMRDFTSA